MNPAQEIRDGIYQRGVQTVKGNIGVEEIL